MNNEIGFLGGLFMGFAASFHCVGMCGGIASTLLFASPGNGTLAGRARALMGIQFGRASSYILLGGLIGSVSAAFSGILELAGLQLFLRLFSAGILVWSGLAMLDAAGPGFARLEKGLAASIGKCLQLLPQNTHRASPVLGGICWGLAPCGMVYGALLNAMLTGSWIGGMIFMSGFALATIPPVALTAFGITTFAACGRANKSAKHVRRAAGVAVTMLGLLSMIEPAHGIAALCG